MPMYRVCKWNVCNDEISRILAIIAHYGEPAIVNSAQRFKQDCVEHLLLVKFYHDNLYSCIFVYYDITKFLIHFNCIGHFYENNIEGLVALAMCRS